MKLGRAIICRYYFLFMKQQTDFHNSGWRHNTNNGKAYFLNDRSQIRDIGGALELWNLSVCYLSSIRLATPAPQKMVLTIETSWCSAAVYVSLLSLSLLLFIPTRALYSYLAAIWSVSRCLFSERLTRAPSTLCLTTPNLSTRTFPQEFKNISGCTFVTSSNGRRTKTNWHPRKQSVAL